MQVCVTTIAYEAEDSIEHLLDRIPETIADQPTFLLVSDDCSNDPTAELASKWAAAHPDMDMHVIRQDKNLGYGGNQKACYRWAIEHGADIVVLLHGDEQYPPEHINELVQPIIDNEADVVFGSRMIIPGGARGGGMPLTRFVGNRFLTVVLNRLGRSHLTEWFSGFRAYRVSSLVATGYEALPRGFDFDTDIIFRLLENQARIVERPIPTRYADEISRVPLLRTGLAALVHGVGSRRRGRRPVHR